MQLSRQQLSHSSPCDSTAVADGRFAAVRTHAAVAQITRSTAASPAGMCCCASFSYSYVLLCDIPISYNPSGQTGGDEMGESGRRASAAAQAACEGVRLCAGRMISPVPPRGRRPPGVAGQHPAWHCARGDIQRQASAAAASRALDKLNGRRGPTTLCVERQRGQRMGSNLRLHVAVHN